MSLAGLLNILDDDPQLRDVLARAGAGTDPVDTDLVAPPALRPVLAAALAQGGGQPTGGGTGFVLAVTATAREAEDRSEEHTSELQSHSDLVCRLLLEKKKKQINRHA